MKSISFSLAGFLRIFCFIFFTAGLAACSGQSAATQSRAGKTLRVMAYNIHHCNPPSKEESGEIDLEAIVSAIRQQKPDLVALQEVDVNTKRSGPVNQATEIGKRLGMQAYFAKALDYTGGEYGVAILSKYPLSETSVLRLPPGADPKSEQRVLASGKVTLPGGLVIRFGSTHLDVRNAQTREAQVREIAAFAARHKEPFIVAGDFNATPESSAIQVLDQHFTRSCQQCDFTIPVINPKRVIDFIAFSKNSPFKALSTQVIPERYASDHLPVVAELAY
ncbi:MAG: endonuclease/exonuclease/phosphatase family protein [Adhaeribacter sp.]